MEAGINQYQQWASVLRDFILILGTPTLIYVALKLYKLQISSLKQQIETLREENRVLQHTQYDKALNLLQSQRDLFEAEREASEDRMQKLEARAGEQEKVLNELQAKYIETKLSIHVGNLLDDYMDENDIHSVKKLYLVESESGGVGFLVAEFGEDDQLRIKLNEEEWQYLKCNKELLDKPDIFLGGLDLTKLMLHYQEEP